MGQSLPQPLTTIRTRRFETGVAASRAVIDRLDGLEVALRTDVGFELSPAPPPDRNDRDRPHGSRMSRRRPGCILRFDPTGAVDRVVPMPVRNPTTCCFGGDDLRTLFVTSSRYGLDEAFLSEHPDEGALMALDVGVAGAATFRFAG